MRINLSQDKDLGLSIEIEYENLQVNDMDAIDLVLHTFGYVAAIGKVEEQEDERLLEDAQKEDEHLREKYGIPYSTVPPEEAFVPSVTHDLSDVGPLQNGDSLIITTSPTVLLSAEAVREMNGDDPGCTVCGRDNRNGTHDALQHVGHLSHTFTTADVPGVAPQPHTAVQPPWGLEPPKKHVKYCDGEHDLLAVSCLEYVKIKKKKMREDENDFDDEECVSDKCVELHKNGNGICRDAEGNHL